MPGPALNIRVPMESDCQLLLPPLSWDNEERSRDFCGPICHRMCTLPPRVESDLAAERSQVGSALTLWGHSGGTEGMWGGKNMETQQGNTTGL